MTACGNTAAARNHDATSVFGEHYEDDHLGQSPVSLSASSTVQVTFSAWRSERHTLFRTESHPSTAAKSTFALASLHSHTSFLFFSFLPSSPGPTHAHLIISSFLPPRHLDQRTHNARRPTHAHGTYNKRPSDSVAPHWWWRRRRNVSGYLSSSTLLPTLLFFYVFNVHCGQYNNLFPHDASELWKVLLDLECCEFHRVSIWSFLHRCWCGIVSGEW